MGMLSQNLTRRGLVLSLHGGCRNWLGSCALTVAGLLLGAAGSYFYWNPQLGNVQQEATAAQDQRQLQQQLEQNRQTLRVSEAHSQELERQIATLIQQLRECQEDLTFFRKTRDSKH